jgi:hypothetical protein
MGAGGPVSGKNRIFLPKKLEKTEKRSILIDLRDRNTRSWSAVSEPDVAWQHFGSGEDGSFSS